MDHLYALADRGRAGGSASTVSSVGGGPSSKVRSSVTGAGYVQKGGEKQDKCNYPSVLVETGNIDFQFCSCYNYTIFNLSLFFVTGLILAIERRYYTAKNPF
jgi:hypothetical protein